MNWWPGSKQDSISQAADREARAAGRNARAAQSTIAALPLVLSDDDDGDYQDCDTSLLFSTDGANDDENIMNAAAAELARQRALPFEESDFENDPDSWKKELKLKFDVNDLKYWFNATESDMKKYGINSQWEKKNAIASMLPPDVTEEVKPILRLTQAEAGDFI